MLQADYHMITFNAMHDERLVRPFKFAQLAIQSGSILRFSRLASAPLSGGKKSTEQEASQSFVLIG